ncbi:BT_3928 family protein [Compostibacter hankyongensis]|uniref:DoxX family protein n=1 Tax=Compostibacter hankyongensis TaxID=1007089 RepID=A0ABP8FMY7_9BACT
MKYILGFFRIVVGLLFIFSGLVKANDPLGLCYKTQEFFDVLHVSFLNPAALTLAIILIGFEIIAGVALLLGCWMRVFGLLLLLVTLLFTFLTAFAYLTGKIKECGCFGDCLPISNTVTFWKDVILLALVIFLFVFRRQIKPVFNRVVTGILLFLGIVVAFGFQWYTLNHLPLVDCLAYKMGSNITESMKPPPGAIPDKYETLFIYEKDGQQKSFTADNIPAWLDSTWQFVDRKDKLVKEGNHLEPKIVDFVVTDSSGNDVTQELLSAAGYTFLFMVRDVNEAGTGWDQKMSALQRACAQSGIRIYGITASSHAAVARFTDTHRLGFPFFQMDATVIKTAARSNPCLILLREGTVLGKWAYRDMPERVSQIPGSDALDLRK